MTRSANTLKSGRCMASFTICGSAEGQAMGFELMVNVILMG